MVQEGMIDYLPRGPDILANIASYPRFKENANCHTVTLWTSPDFLSSRENHLATDWAAFHETWDVKSKIHQNQLFYTVGEIHHFITLYAPENHFLSELSPPTKKNLKAEMPNFPVKF